MEGGVCPEPWEARKQVRLPALLRRNLVAALLQPLAKALHSPWCANKASSNHFRCQVTSDIERPIVHNAKADINMLSQAKLELGFLQMINSHRRRVHRHQGRGGVALWCLPLRLGASLGRRHPRLRQV